MLLLFSALLVIAVFSAKISARFGIPVLVAFIGLGVLVGSDVLNLFYFDDAALTKRIADILLIFILFDGGFRTTRRDLRSVAGPALALATIGVAITAGALGYLIHLVTRLDLARSLMIGSIISSTDAAAVMLVTRQNPIRERVASTLKVESAANDPMAIILTLVFVETLSGSRGGLAAIAVDLVWQFAGGVLLGLLLSKAGAWLFDRLDSENRGYYHVLAVGLILLAYGLAELLGANGIIAVFFMGYWLGNSDFAGKRAVDNFLEGISAFGNVALFLMLGLLAFPSDFAGIWKEGVLIALLMFFLARPVAVFLCTLPFRYSLRERVFLIWGGIKGAVPIVLATYPAAYGLDPEGTVFNIIFFAVLLSCVIQGGTMGFLARLLRLTVPPKPHSPYSLELHAMRKADLDLFELRVEKDAQAAGKAIRDLRLDADTLISSIVRGGRMIAPRGHTQIHADDLLFILAPPSMAQSIGEAINASEPPAQPEGA